VSAPTKRCTPALVLSTLFNTPGEIGIIILIL
jgi:hypothetical protein